MENNSQVKTKFFDFFYSEIITIENPIIVEFGVRHGISTSIFLDICELKMVNYIQLMLMIIHINSIQENGIL